MKARILSIYDEGAVVGTPLIGAKGLSIMVEVDGQRILFDTGRRGNYLKHNLDHLEIPAESIDSLVLSHGHRDHTGGLNSFLEERESPVTIYSHEGLWTPRAGTVAGIRVRDIGPRRISEENREKAVLRNVEGWTEISEHLYSLSLPPAAADPRNRKLVDGAWAVDDMCHETALVVITRKGPVLICACCHTGLLNALKAVKEMTGREVSSVIGGVHLRKVKNDMLDGLAAALRDDMKTPSLYLCHCTSDNSKTRLRTTLGLAGVRDFYVGTEVQFDV